MKTAVSVIVLTFNEETNLEACLRGIRDWALEIFIVDSGSTDDTLRIAEAYGAIVFRHAFDSHARQWEWALSALPVRGEWIMGLDADQVVSPELAREIQTLGAPEFRDIDGVYVNRRQIFRNQWIRHGGYYPKYLLKIFRPGKAVTDENDLVDHHFHIPGRVAKLKGDLIEANRKEDDISFWIEKHNRYARKLALEEFRRRKGQRPDPITASWTGNPDQRTLQMKKMWLHVPLYVRPFLYFGYRYFLRLGFLDGKEGAIFHFMHAFWFRLLVDINLDAMLSRNSAD
ncbi:MAG TPA: glycosyltransferase family 2 protein [Bryobacteraceae bacterium]|nr:glycosyltransferase family 2 protein [Bryobacteraceae bacterium]